MRIQVPITSAAIVESKSLKLYLNSFAQTRFANNAEVQKTLDSDLTLAFRSPVMIELSEPDALTNAATGLPGECLDDLEVAVEQFTLNPDLLGRPESRKDSIASNGMRFIGGIFLFWCPIPLLCYP